MKKVLLSSFVILNIYGKAQNRTAVTVGSVAAATTITFLAANVVKKEVAKEISQFRSKEYIINNLIGNAGDREIKFETES